MGRHSIAYIAAQRESSTGAATYIGRVGALALALGIGAAVAGGNGISHADETGGGDGNDTSSEAAAGPKSGDTDSSSAEAPTTEAPTTKVGPASLSGLVASIPKTIADGLQKQAAATKKKRPKSTAGAHTTTRSTGQAAAVDKSAVPTTSADTPADSRPEAEFTTASIDVVAPARGQRTPSTTTVIPLPAARLASSTKAQPALTNPIATVVSGVLSALGIAPSASNPDGTPTSPMPIINGVLQLVRREIESFALRLTAPLAATTTAQTNANPAVSPGVPSPTDEATTPYGDIGKWMLQSNGQIADYGGQPYKGKTILEPVNVIIVDPNSTSVTQAKYKLNGAMFWSGFAAQPIHTGGFEGTIDDTVYGQQPNLPLFGYSNNLFVLPNDHGRIFGPDPVETSTGYVWSGAFSTEEFGIVHGFLPGHTYVSSNTARNALATRLILSGRATYGGMVPLDNAYNTNTTTTGDHDGYAVVLILK